MITYDHSHVTGDLSGITMDGNVLPLRGGKLLRGEDIVFLMEGCVDRLNAITHYYRPQYGDWKDCRKMDGDTMAFHKNLLRSDVNAINTHLSSMYTATSGFLEELPTDLIGRYYDTASIIETKNLRPEQKTSSSALPEIDGANMLKRFNDIGRAKYLYTDNVNTKEFTANVTNQIGTPIETNPKTCLYKADTGYYQARTAGVRTDQARGFSEITGCVNGTLFKVLSVGGGISGKVLSVAKVYAVISILGYWSDCGEYHGVHKYGFEDVSDKISPIIDGDIVSLNSTTFSFDNDWAKGHIMNAGGTIYTGEESTGIGPLTERYCSYTVSPKFYIVFEVDNNTKIS